MFLVVDDVCNILSRVPKKSLNYSVFMLTVTVFLCLVISHFHCQTGDFLRKLVGFDELQNGTYIQI